MLLVGASMSARWDGWARQQQGLRPLEKTCLCQLATFSDWRGVSVISAQDMADILGCTWRTVMRIYGSLKAKGLIRIEPRRTKNGQRAASKVRLIWKQPTSNDNQKASDILKTDKAAAQPQEITSDVHSFPGLLARISIEGWEGEASEELGTLLAEEVPIRFSKIYKQQKTFGDIDDVFEVVDIAWQHVRLEFSVLLSADNPWGLLQHMVQKNFARSGQSKHQSREVFGFIQSLSDLDENEKAVSAVSNSTREWDKETSGLVGIDDFWPELMEFVQDLIEFGIFRPVAFSGTCRVLEIACQTKTNRHYFIVRDSRLLSHGIGKDAARAWMTVLTGDRNGKSIVDLRNTSARKAAAEHVANLSKQHVW